MKTSAIRPSHYAVCRRSTYAPYPGAATRRRFWDRLLDAALAAAITVAIVVIFLFLIIL